jgi:hypothetical protein
MTAEQDRSPRRRSTCYGESSPQRERKGKTVMRVSIKLTPRAAAELYGDGTASELKERLAATAERAGTSLEPMHPDADDNELRTYFYADVEDDRVDELLERLREDQEIEGAYVKPPDALP